MQGYLTFINGVEGSRTHQFLFLQPKTVDFWNQEQSRYRDTEICVNFRDS